MREEKSELDSVHALCVYPTSNPPLVTLVGQAGNGVALAVLVGTGVKVAVLAHVAVLVRVPPCFGR